MEQNCQVLISSMPPNYFSVLFSILLLLFTFWGEFIDSVSPLSHRVFHFCNHIFIYKSLPFFSDCLFDKYYAFPKNVSSCWCFFSMYGLFSPSCFFLPICFGLCLSEEMLSTRKSGSHGETDRMPAFGHGWGWLAVVLLKSAPAGF